MRTYSAILNRSQMGKFLSFLYELEVARGVIITNVPDLTQTKLDNYRVTIIPLNGFWVEILEGSFTDGLLHHDGWDKIFIVQENLNPMSK